jgi:hypothetical protein
MSDQYSSLEVVLQCRVVSNHKKGSPQWQEVEIDIKFLRNVTVKVFLPKQAMKKRLLFLHLHHAQVPEKKYLKRRKA